MAGFDEALPNLPELDGFCENSPEPASIIRNVGLRACLYADNDIVVAPERTLAMAVRLDAAVEHVPGHHHFTESTGVFELPQLLPLLGQVPGLGFDATAPIVKGPTSPAELEVLAMLEAPLVIDVRDPAEVAKGKGDRTETNPPVSNPLSPISMDPSRCVIMLNG